MLAPSIHLRKPWKLVALPVKHLERKIFWIPTVYVLGERAGAFVCATGGSEGVGFFKASLKARVRFLGDIGMQGLPAGLIDGPW